VAARRVVRAASVALCSETESGAFRKITALDRRREGTNVQRYKRG